MKFNLLVFFVIHLSFQIFSQILSEEFKNKIENNQIEYKSSSLLIDTKLSTTIIKNDITLKHVSEDFFVLYSVFPLDKNLTQNKNNFISRDEEGNPIVF